MNKIYSSLKKSLRKQAEKNDLFGKKVVIKFKTLSPAEAIGNPEDQDYPIIKGRERMIEAEFEGCKGQAFTDEFGNASYSIDEILVLELNTNRRRAEFIATLNAVYRYLELCEKTIHCRDSEPRQCGRDLLDVLDPKKKILLVGLQPRLLEAIASRQDVRVIDLDPDNIGKHKFGVTVETEDNTNEAIEWCDELLVTGSTIVNGTIERFLNVSKPVTFFGVTISAPAVVLDLDTYCSSGH